MRRFPLLYALVALLAPAAAGAANADCDVEAAVAGWAEAWSPGDAAPLAGPVAFEFLVTDTGDTYRVELPEQGAGRVVPAGDDEPTTRFKAERALFCDIAAGRMNILTTLGKARADDATPMEIDVEASYAQDGRVRRELMPAWYGLEPGMHVNRDPADQANPFDSIFIIIAGPVHARFDGELRMLEAGQSVYVSAGMRHEFWVEAGRGEFIVVMSGEGA